MTWIGVACGTISPIASVDQRCFGPSHGMRGVLEPVEADAADPFGNETSYCRVGKC
jgi:hypothetical protein